jgi:hypothetical protein
MKWTWTESTCCLKVFEELVVDEPQSPICGKGRSWIFKIRNRRLHIKTNLQLRRQVRVGDDSCRKDFDLWNENLSRFDGTVAATVRLCIF